jgi:uncharacterized protein (DUF1501 family)
MKHCRGFDEWQLSRRTVLRAGALGAVGWLTAPRTALADLAIRSQAKERDVLVVIFLRGGADGLNVVVPYADDLYHKARPTLGLSAPTRGNAASRVLDLNGYFGFHPAMTSMMPLYEDGKLAIIHAVGSQDGTRSHFEAMLAMERGLARMGPGAQNGWLARYLQASEGGAPLRAVSFADVLPDSLRGATNTTNLRDLSEFKLQGDTDFRKYVAELYGSPSDEMAAAGRGTLKILDSLDRLDYSAYRPEGSAAYPDSELGAGLKQTAFLIKADVGVEIASLDHGGWDTHFAQGSSSGLQAGLQTDLAASLRAFTDDLGDRLDRVTVVVMTEFGRRIGENSTLGTDHGRGSVMFAIGNHVNGGKIHGKWPGLDLEDQEGPGDLRVTTDYRTVLAEVLEKRLAFARTEEVFPGFKGARLGVVA